jgi:hypothetical protein
MKNIVLTGIFVTLFSVDLSQENREIETVTVRPTEIDDVLINPGIGFTTFQRFNGDALNDGLGWTEGLLPLPISVLIGGSWKRHRVFITGQ